MRLMVLVVAVFGILASSGAVAVIDCSRAKSNIDKLICSSSKLGLAQEQMAFSFRQAVNRGVDPAMLRRANRKRHTAMIPVRLVEADARELPFRSGTFTTVVIGLALCTISDPGLALAEARRVSADGAELHFLEHVRSPRRAFGRLEDVLAPAWRRLAGGCRPNQNTVTIIEESGWHITSLWRSRHGGLVQGCAVNRHSGA